MAEISKQALKVDNNQSFPNNNNGAITPSILRAFNLNMIDSLVDEIGYTADSGSWNQQIDALEQFTASAIGLSTGSLLVTASAVGNVITFTKGNASTFDVTIATGSAGGDVTALNAFTASQLDINAGYNTFTQSANTSLSNLNSATSSYVTEAESGSFLLTASFDNGTRNLTFTKGNNTTFAVNIPDVSGSAGNFVSTASFNAYTQSNDQRVSSLESTSASLLVETQNLELFSASALISISNLNASSASQQVSINNLNTTTASLLIETSNLELFSASALTSLSNLNTATSSLFTSASLALTTASVSGQTMTFTKGNGSTFNVTLPTGSGGGTTDLTSLNAFTASQYVSNSFFATTGSNTFTGDQTLIDAGGNTITLSDTSGSLMLVAKTYTSASAHLSSSVGAKVNIIWKDNSNTADTIISGSNNIFVNPAAAAAGFKRYVGGSNNIFNGTGLPSISASMGFSPNMGGNIGAGAYTFRGPVSSSAWNINNNISVGSINLGSSAVLNAEKLTGGLNLAGNVIQGTVSIIANQSALTGSNTALLNNSINGTVTVALSSSAASLSNNVINDSAFTLTNQFYSSSVGLGVLNMNRNNIGGQTNSIIVTGSQPTGTTTATSISENLVYGGNNTLYVDITNARVSGATTYHNLLRTSVLGNGLIVSGSSLSTDTNSFGSAFVGRWNAVDGIRNKTSDIVFAVGTGTSTTRKTGFLVDSGSNTFVEGTLNVSGASSLNGNLNITGSLTASLQEGYVWVGNASGLTTTVATSSFGGGGGSVPAGTVSSSAQIVAYNIFATTGSNTFVGNQTVSASVSIRGNTLFTSVSGDQSSVILGNDALATSVGGNINVAIGNSAMKNASGSSQNVAIGNRALFKSTGSFNIAIGSETLTENTTGTNNIAIGLNALNLNTTGGENFAMGSNSMMFTSASTATSNVAIGASTLTRNQVDSQIAIGANALQLATTGNANTAIGRLAMQNTTTGTDNLAIGASALLSNVTGQRNIGIGTAALRNAAEGASRNIGIGVFSLYNAKSSNSVGIGHSAFENLQTGSTNVGIGYLAGYNITTGNYNTLIGGDLRGQDNWNNVVAISDGQANIKFFNSGSRTTITNNTLISGSLTTTGSLTIQSGSSFFANGNKQFNIGAFQSNVSQSGSAGVSQSMNFEVTDISEGITIASNSRITLANSGTYNIQFSAQLLADTGADDVYIWLKKNGVNVTASAGHVTLANNEELIAAWNYVVNAAANDYFEIAWQSTNGDALLLTEGATGNIPSVPSIILTVTQIR